MNYVLDWLATKNERREKLPGDDLVSEARGSSTHAIAIDATSDDVWPWLVQMGCDRAGFYSYDLLDNAGRRSATRIVPEFQNISVGDILPSRPGSPNGFEVLRLEKPTMLLLGAYLRVPGFSNLAWHEPRPAAHIRSTWLFLLREQQNQTRLLVRARGIIHPWWLRIMINSLMVPTHIVMQRKQLLNLRGRAERLTRSKSV